MQIIDSQHHLWDISKPWYPEFSGAPEPRIWGSTGELQRSYLLEDYFKDVQDADVVKSVHIQACTRENAIAETQWLQDIADDPKSRGFPHAIVAWADLSDSRVEASLAAQRAFPNVRGIRQVLTRNCDPLLNQARIDFLNDTVWLGNFGKLADYGLSFDLQLSTPQLTDAAQLAGDYPDVMIALLHYAFPVERHRAGVERWRAGMRELSKHASVYVKLCGLGMTDCHWSANSIKPFVFDAIDIFGVDRCMFGSNFPVDSLTSSYSALVHSMRDLFSLCSEGDRQKIFYANAARFYRI
jgi:predicted TIM-barrel fold metal-dependent hydrolase